MYCPYCGVANPDGTTKCRLCGKDMTAQSTVLICPSCGADVHEYQSTCGRCGTKLLQKQMVAEVEAETEAAAETEEVVKETSAPTSQEESAPYRDWVVEPTKDSTIKINRCPICGKPKHRSADMCDECKQSETGYSYKSGTELTYTSDMDLPEVAGILIFIAGALGIAHGLVTFETVTGEGLPMAVVCLSGLMLMFGLLAILGSIHAYARRNAVFATLGAVFGILSLGFYIGALLSFVGLVLVLKSYSEYSDKTLSLDIMR